MSRRARGRGGAKGRPDERGIALLSVLGILAVLLVLGALVASASRMESTLSGSSRFSARAFAAADAGLSYALGDANNFIDPAFTCTPVYTPRHADLASAGLGIAGDVDVCFLYEGPPPTSIKVSAIKFKAFHFDVGSTGNGPANAASNLEMEAARLGPAQ
jgi:hypothetical protein